MTESLRDQIARLIYDVHNDPFVDSEACADAVLPLVEAEVERRTAALTAERDEAELAMRAEVALRVQHGRDRHAAEARLAEVRRERDDLEVAMATVAAGFEAARARVTDLEAVLREVLDAGDAVDATFDGSVSDDEYTIRVAARDAAEVRARAVLVAAAPKGDTEPYDAEGFVSYEDLGEWLEITFGGAPGDEP